MKPPPCRQTSARQQKMLKFYHHLKKMLNFQIVLRRVSLTGPNYPLNSPGCTALLTSAGWEETGGADRQEISEIGSFLGLSTVSPPLLLLPCQAPCFLMSYFESPSSLLPSLLFPITGWQNDPWREGGLNLFKHQDYHYPQTGGMCPAPVRISFNNNKYKDSLTEARPGSQLWF